MNENSNLIAALSRLIQLILVGVVFGLVVAFVAHFFVLGVQFFTSFRGVVAPIQISGFELHYAQFFTLGFVALCIIAIKKNLGIARWHGPADSIHAAHRTDNELDIKSGLSSTLVAFLSASGGASVGQYGPLVHFGAVIGSALKRFSKSGISTDIFIGCGVAAAISAGFNAPIAGVIFAHEAIIRHFSLKAIAPIAIASCVAAGVTELFWGGTTLFEIGGFDGDLSTLLPIALLLGPFFGVLAVGFMLSVRRVAAFTASGRFTPAQAVLIAATITAIGGAFVPETLGLGGETVRGAIGMQYTLAFLFIVLFLKIILTSVCLGMGLFGGIFSPSLVIGAAGGAIALHILASLGLDLPGTVGIVICGIAAVSSSVIGAPIAGTIIILELTGSYEFALLAMISIVTSVLTSHLLFGNSFFDRQLLDRGIDISSGRTGLEMMERNIETIVHQDYCRLNSEDSNQTAINLLIESGSTEAYILGPDKSFLGKVALQTLLKGAPDGPAIAEQEVDPISIKSDASLQQAMEIAVDFVGESIPVIDRISGSLIGIVTEADLFRDYLALQNRVVDLERR